VAKLRQPAKVLKSLNDWQSHILLKFKEWREIREQDLGVFREDTVLNVPECSMFLVLSTSFPNNIA